ncbi:MAG: fibronectin type III domain-containing protein, partial [Thermoplasmata archaeon]
FSNAGNSNEWKVYFSAGFNRASVFSDTSSPYQCTYGVLSSHTTSSITVTLFNHAGNSLLITITCTEDLSPPAGLSFVPVQDLDSHGGDHIHPDIGYDDDTTISFTISVIPTDTLSGLPTNYISYRLNAGAWSAWTSSITTTYTSSDGVTDGTYVCDINVTDNVGNYLTQSATIIVDTTNPTGSVTIVESPSSPYIYYNSGTGIFYYSDMMGATPQNFELQVSFISQGVSQAWKVNFSLGFNQNTIFSDDSSPYSRIYGVTASHSTTQIYAVLYNHAGNAVNISITCVEDTVAPSGYSFEPIPDANSDGGIDIAPDTGYDDDHTLDFRVTGSIIETSSGLPTNCYTYKLGTGAWSAWSSSSTVQYTVASDGSYTCYVNVTDNVGNVASVPLSATLVSDTVHPIASYTLEESPPSPYLYYNTGTGVFFYSALMGATPQPFYLNASFDALGFSGEWYVVYSSGFDQASTLSIYAPSTYSRIYSVINTHSTSQLTITLYSHSGNAVRLTITCTKDTTPPTGFSIAPVADADSNGGDDIAPNTGYDDDTTISFQVTGGSDSSSGLPTNRYSFLLDTGSWSSWGSSSTVTYTSVSDGAHTCSVRMIDNVGNTATVSTPATITVDTNPPTGCYIQISESASHIYLNATTLFYTSLTNGESFTITATFGNPGNSLAWKVNFSAGFDRNAFEDSSSPYSGLYTIQTSHSTSSLKIVFFNNAGNSMTIYQPCVKDSTPPTLTLGSLQPFYTTSIFTVSWSATDNVGGSGLCEVQRYDVEYNDNGAGWTAWKVGTMQTSDTFTGWNGHTYTFRARARDNVNNTCAYVTSITVMIDTSLPISSVNPLPPYTNTHEIYVSWNATDPAPGSGISRIFIQVRIDDGPFTDWFPAGVTNNSAIYYGEDGHRYYFQCIAVDNASNSEIYPGLDGDTFTFVDTLPPLTPSLNYPDDNPSYIITNALGTSKPVFSWTSQADPGNSGISSSIIEVYSSSNPSVPLFSINIVHGTPSATHTAESNISLEPGNYTWRVCDIDKAGNVGSWSAWRRFRIDARPSVILTSPQTNSEYNGNLIITWTATDPDADNLGLLSVSVYYHTASNATAPGWTLIENAQTDGMASWNTLAVPDGNYYIMLVVNDTILDNNTVSGPFIIKNYNITLIPDQVEKFVDPGCTIEFAIHAHNYGTVGYDISLTLGEIPGWTLSLSVQSINLQPGNDVVFILYATAPIDSLAGETAYIQITGAPQDTGGAGGCSLGVRAVVNQIENVSISQ